MAGPLALIAFAVRSAIACHHRSTLVNVAITGATGFIGSHVLIELHEVTGLVQDDIAAPNSATRGALLLDEGDPGK